MITLKAKGSIDNEGIACKVETGRALAVAGLHPATGGSGLELCSGDMLLEALVACAGVTLKSVATAIEMPLKTGIVTRRGRSRFSRHARRRQGGAGRLCRNPPAFRRRYRGAAGQARSAAETHRALLRGLPDHQERPEGFGDDAAGVIGSTVTLPWRGRVGSHRAQRNVSRGGVISPQALIEPRDCHPTPPLISFASTRERASLVSTPSGEGKKAFRL
jgi:hypothetical protein